MRLRSNRTSAAVTQVVRGEQVRIATKDELAPLTDYVDKEISAAWLRKSSFETRALSLVTLNIGAVTLYFALVKGFGLDFITDTGPSRMYLLFVVLAAARSIGAAAFSALPANYSSLRENDFDDFLTEVLAGDGTDHHQVMLELKISQLGTAIQSNQRKAVSIFVSFVSFGIMALLLIISLLTSLTSA